MLLLLVVVVVAAVCLFVCLVAPRNNACAICQAAKGALPPLLLAGEKKQKLAGVVLCLSLSLSRVLKPPPHALHSPPRWKGGRAQLLRRMQPP